MFTLVKNQKLDSSAGYLPSVLSKITSIPAGFVGICSAEHFLLGLQNKGNVLCGCVCVSVHTPTPQPHCHLLLTFSYQNLFFLFKIIFLVIQILLRNLMNPQTPFFCGTETLIKIYLTFSEVFAFHQARVIAKMMMTLWSWSYH